MIKVFSLFIFHIEKRIIIFIMANCTSYTLGGLNATCKNSIGGISEIYIANYDDLWKTTIDDNGKLTPYLHRGTTFYKFELRKGQASFSANLNTNENGSDYFTNAITMNFTKMDTIKRNQIMALVGTDVIVIFKDNNGKCWFLGKDEPAQVTELSGSTGNNRSDANIYTITLTEESSELPFEVPENIYEGIGIDWTQEYLTFETTTNNTIILLYVSEPADSEDSEEFEVPIILQASMDKINWYTIDTTQTHNSFAEVFGLETFNAGTKIYVRGQNNSFVITSEYKAHIVFSQPTYVYGNLLSTLDGDEFRTITHLPIDQTLDPTEAHGEFTSVFDSEGCRILVNGNAIPLINNPILSHPTKELTIPIVEALVDDAFSNMFKNCNLLEQAPYIMVNSDDAGSDLFDGMFYGCSRLKYIRCDDNYLSGYFTNWTYSVSANGTFVTTNPSQWSRGVDGIPNNWQVIKK